MIRATIIVHGGAGKPPEDLQRRTGAGVENCRTGGVAKPRRGGSAVDAAEAAVAVLEDDPAFNAGRGAASCTGNGDCIIRVTLARSAVDRLADGMDPMQAAREAIADLTRNTQGDGGLILVDALGRIGYAFNTPAMSCATMDAATGTPRMLS